MHEVSLVHALFDEADHALASHHPKDVRALTVRIGALAGVDPELFRVAFDGCRRERGYDAATLVVVFEAAVWRCSACGAAVTTDGPLRCAVCDADATLAAGGELFLDRIELEVSDV